MNLSKNRELKSIGRKSFYGLVNLKKLTISSTVKEIRKQAFKDTQKLSVIEYKGDKMECSLNAFSQSSVFGVKVSSIMVFKMVPWSRPLVTHTVITSSLSS